nr:MAG TPA: hypothetical protein [Caudoviricetes sp.]
MRFMRKVSNKRWSHESIVCGNKFREVINAKSFM